MKNLAIKSILSDAARFLTMQKYQAEEFAGMEYLAFLMDFLMICGSLEKKCSCVRSNGYVVFRIFSLLRVG